MSYNSKTENTSDEIKPIKDTAISDKIAEWVSKGLDVKDDPLKIISEYADEVANRGLTTTQLRKFFAAVKKIDIKYKIYSELDKEDFKANLIEEDFKTNLIEVKMILPILAYSVGRAKDEKKDPKKHSKTALTSFNKVMGKGINAIHEYNQFKNFVKVFEAIIAYHKFHGGRD